MTQPTGAPWRCTSMVQRDGHSPATRCSREDEHGPTDEHRYTYRVYLLTARAGADPGALIDATLTWREPDPSWNVAGSMASYSSQRPK